MNEEKLKQEHEHKHEQHLPPPELPSSGTDPVPPPDEPPGPPGE